MIKKIKCTLLYGLLFMCMALLSPVLAQQDDHISQFSTSPMVLNPALTGMFKGNYRGQLLYRTQWAALTTHPFVNEVAAFDLPRKRFGYGLVFMSNKAGAGNMNSTSLHLSCAYEITNDPAEIHHLTAGVQLGFINKSVDISKLTFAAQYDPNAGAIDANASNQENFQSTSYTIPDVNFGIYYSNTNKEKMFNPYLGASGFHLTIPQETFLSSDNRIPVRWLIHGGSKIRINNLINVEPSFLYQQQNNVRETNLGAIGDYFLVEENTHLQLGLFYRYQDAFIFHLAVLYKEYALRMSYDMNNSALSVYTNHRGGFEISLIYTKENRKYVPSF